MTTQLSWDTELSDYLSELTNVQSELLVVLKDKHVLMAAADMEGLEQTQLRAEQLAARLQACQDRRQELLQQAAQQGYSAGSLQQLAKALPTTSGTDLAGQMKTAAASSELLRQQTLTNWIFAQRSLLHVAEMLEIIATGGRLLPTYGSHDAGMTSGSLLNQEA